MCTVTFIPVADTVFITHNRDEKFNRSKAIPPREYIVNGFRLLYPRDQKAGGTWIGMNENGSTAVLLNGGFVKHEPRPPYRKSRGLIFLDVCASPDMMDTWHVIDLMNIEPFTLILWNNGELFECRWDGSKKHVHQLDASHHHIWSSSTLYDPEITAKRKQWFEEWQLVKTQPDRNDIIDFHLSGGEGDTYNDLRMNRDGFLLTLSITSLQLTRRSGNMKYLDLQDNLASEKELTFSKAQAAIQ